LIDEPAREVHELVGGNGSGNGNRHDQEPYRAPYATNPGWGAKSSWPGFVVRHNVPDETVS